MKKNSVDDDNDFIIEDASRADQGQTFRIKELGGRIHPYSVGQRGGLASFEFNFSMEEWTLV